MAYRTLIFGVDDLFGELCTYYAQEVRRGTFDIVAYAVLENDQINLVMPDGRPGGGDRSVDFELAIVSSFNDFYRRMKFLEAQGLSRDKIIDGRVFTVPELDFPRLLKEGVAYGVLDKNSFIAKSYTIYPQVYKFKGGGSIFILGTKSYIGSNTSIKGDGLISVAKNSCLAEDIIFSLGQNFSHNYRRVSLAPLSAVDWNFPKEFMPPQGVCKILIGNDVWIGRGCVLKATNPNKPLVIGDGAVVASDSVVVKNVPPYAIVGGNPAQIIKYRFPPHVINALQRIKWWDWSLDKIYDNFKYFNDVEKFISLHDRS